MRDAQHVKHRLPPPDPLRPCHTLSLRNGELYSQLGIDSNTERMSVTYFTIHAIFFATLFYFAFQNTRSPVQHDRLQYDHTAGVSHSQRLHVGYLCRFIFLDSKCLLTIIDLST